VCGCIAAGCLIETTYHSAFRKVMGTVLGMDLNEHWRLRQDNACLNIIDFPEWDKVILMLFNDHSHLEFP
ncbi:MAG: hypothetical protein PHY77_05870, partial [Desulfotomaculaceae bacterium]|nr:hypothetical protein [Desulfotomaculaceae bacterium]